MKTEVSKEDCRRVVECGIVRLGSRSRLLGEFQGRITMKAEAARETLERAAGSIISRALAGYPYDDQHKAEHWLLMNASIASKGLGRLSPDGWRLMRAIIRAMVEDVKEDCEFQAALDKAGAA